MQGQIIYKDGVIKEVYGYKLQLNNDDSSTFTVLEEGVEVGEFVCLSESPSAEG